MICDNCDLNLSPDCTHELRQVESLPDKKGIIMIAIKCRGFRTPTPERDKVLDELKTWCLKMKCNGCPYGGILFYKMSELASQRGIYDH